MKPSLEQIEAALRASAKEAEQLRRQNRDLREAGAEPIAIVGMACRYPGGVASPAQLWELLAAGGDGDRRASRPIAAGTWSGSTIPTPTRPATSYTREGRLPRRRRPTSTPASSASARARRSAIDPAAAAAAGSLLGGARGRRASTRPRCTAAPTGVFAGVMYHDYGWGLPATAEDERALGTGGSSSVVSGRVAYTLGLEGPAISVDTACSSSLVGDPPRRAGPAEGASARWPWPAASPSSPRPASSSSSAASAGWPPTVAARPSPTAADGAGFSEGVGVLVLERLSDASASGHRVLATIRGSAVNQDGASNGITAPNGPSQERVIRQALANAGLGPADVELVEAHGTGTALGDPIEASALLATYGQEQGGAASPRLAQVEHRPRPGGGRGRRGDQGGDGDARRDDAQDPARRGALRPGRLGQGQGRAAGRAS